jgi:hypothetical protein
VHNPHSSPRVPLSPIRGLLAGLPAHRCSRCVTGVWVPAPPVRQRERTDLAARSRSEGAGAAVKTHRRSFLLATALFIVVACSSERVTRAVPTVGATAAADEWRITLHVSGGLAGLDRELQIASSGEVTAIDRRRRLQVAGLVPAGDLKEIASVVEAAEPASDMRPNDCRDCLVYDVELRAADRTRIWHMNDANLAGSAPAQLVDLLMSVMNRALSGQLNP